MSQTQQGSSEGHQAPLLLESHFSTELHIYEPGDKKPPSPQSETPKEDQVDRALPQQVLLSTQSPAALKKGTRQLIPRGLATASGRPKNRHHTTVVTFPVGLENSTRVRHSTQGPDVSWEDYDSDGDGFALRRNRRNKSYRAAVTSLDIGAMTKGEGSNTLLKPTRPGRAPSPNPARSPGRKVRKLGGGASGYSCTQDIVFCLNKDLRFAKPLATSCHKHDGRFPPKLWRSLPSR